MKKHEHLFLAIGAADEDLLRRSEESGKRRRLRLWGAALTAAACLALILTALLPRLTDGGNVIPPSPSGPDDPPAVVTPPENTPPEDVTLPTDPDISFDPQSPDAVFHFLQYTGDAEAAAPGFTIYINEELYALSKQNGACVVRPKDPVQIPGAELPPCELWITHQSQSLEEAKAALPESWRTKYPTLSDWESDPLTGALRLYGWESTDWDAEYFEAFLFDDGEGGAYVLSFTCFMEAVEGHGARFADMIRTFRPVRQGVPLWLTELDTAAQAVTRAVLTGSLSDGAAYIAEGADMEGYGEDASPYVSISAFNYTVDDVRSPASAIVSVQCRVDIEDSYDYLTIEMRYQNGRWLALWSGLEK